MDNFRRNVIVGIFAIGGLVAVAIMVLLFGYSPAFWSKGYEISIYAPSAGPIHGDDPVMVNGITAGRVKWAEPKPDIREGVRIVCEINPNISIPENAAPVIKEQSIGFGKPAIRIDVGPKSSANMLPKDGTGSLKASTEGGIAEVIPKEIISKVENATVAITRLADALKPVADDLHVLFKPQPLTTFEAQTQAATQPAARPLANISTAVQRLDIALKSFNDVLANPDNKNNVAAMLRNFRVVSENGVELTRSLKTTAQSLDGKIDKIAGGLITNTDKLSKLFDELNTVARKISEGPGTAGKFLNDPELFDSLSFTVKKLSETIDELRALIVQWQERGLKIQGGLLGK